MRLVLALCLFHLTTAQSTHRVCGSDYNDASYNCESNPKCPSGDGCPAEKDTCFALPDYACMSATDSPTPNPIEASNITSLPTIGWNATATDAPVAAPKHVFVCGEDYTDASANCMTNEKCSNGDGCASSSTCYAIPADSCTTSSPQVTSSPVISKGIPTPSPSDISSNRLTFPPSETFTAQSTGNKTSSPSEPTPVLNTSSPSPVPTYNTRFCGSNYTDASSHCSNDRACPGGFECVNGETCYAGIVCQVTDAPTESPTGNNRFCGFNYSQALEQCSFERACPLGTECIDGMSCFTGITCSATSFPPTSEPTLPISVSATPTESFSAVPTQASVANTQFCGFNYTDATEAGCNDDRACPLGSEQCNDGMACFTGVLCPVKNETYPPSLAPTTNVQFCGYNWTDAINNVCNADKACPSGHGCEDGMTCYITAETCSSNSSTPAPTENSSFPTPVMANSTPAPSTYNHFCGSSLFEAWQTCSLETACPLGNECPAGTACFSVFCTSSDDARTPTPVPNDDTSSSSPSIRGSVSTASPSDANHWYCGSTLEDATDNCAVNKPCRDGMADVCSDGQTCYLIPNLCTIPAPSPEYVVTQTPTKGLSNSSSFCGYTWADAKENCYTAATCTPGSVGECPDNQGCFDGIIDCKAPNVTGAAFYSSYGRDPSGSETEVEPENYLYGLTTNPEFIRSSSWSRHVSCAALFVAYVTGTFATLL